MSEVRFGNKPSSKKNTKKEAVSDRNGVTKSKVDAHSEVDHISPQSDLLNFVSQKAKEQEEIPMRQVMFRIPMPLWQKIKQKKGEMSTQKLYATLSEYYVNQQQ